MKLKLFLSLVVAAGLMTANFQTNANESLSATLIIVNANVRTMDSAKPTAEAIAVHGNRIVAVGSSAEIRKLAGSGMK